MDRQAVLEWGQRQYGTLPDDLWALYPHYAVWGYGWPWCVSLCQHRGPERTEAG